MLKIISFITYSLTIGGFALFQTLIEPNPVWLALVFGSMCGLLARLALDVSKHGRQNLIKVVFESLATVFLMTGGGLFLIEFGMYYFEIRKKIETGIMHKDLPVYFSAFFSCLATIAGRDGIEFAGTLTKALLTQYLTGKKNNE